MSTSRYIPEDLDEEQRKIYIRLMDQFAEENSRVPRGKMGSYCLSGQQAFAYHVAKGDWPKITESSIEEFRECCKRPR